MHVTSEFVNIGPITVAVRLTPFHCTLCVNPDAFLCTPQFRSINSHNLLTVECHFHGATRSEVCGYGH